MSRPEHLGLPEDFYDQEEVESYAQNSRMIKTQQELAERALELLSLPQPSGHLLLDLGCGCGISGSVLSEHGHAWVGLDVSRPMLEKGLDYADGDLVQGNLGHTLPFRAGAFDGAISISAIQWLCYPTREQPSPYKRLVAFFQSLLTVLAHGARAVLQFYPESPAQIEMVTSAALRVGFRGGLLVDFPNSSKAKKHYIVIYTGAPLADSYNEEKEEWKPAKSVNRIRQVHNVKQKRLKQAKMKTPKERIEQLKERRRLRGQEVKPGSKYSGRKRGNGF